MTPLTYWPRLVACGVAFASTLHLLNAEPRLKPDGVEYPIAGSFVGDQVFPDLALGSSGAGYLVWQDSAADGKGFSIVGRRVTPSGGPDVTAAFRLNQTTVGNQLNPSVALAPDGGASFVWHGGNPAKQLVYLRSLTPAGLFASGEVAISQPDVDSSDAAVTVLQDGRVVVVWSSFKADGDMFGVFGRILSNKGEALTPVFQVNTFTRYSQRSAAVATLDNGNFVVVWVSEQQRIVASTTSRSVSVDIMARVFGTDGQPVGGELRLNNSDRPCSNPSLTTLESAGNDAFFVTWNQRAETLANGWDVAAGAFRSNGSVLVAPSIINTTRENDQIAPQAARLGATTLVTWASREDLGPAQSVRGQLFNEGRKTGDEILMSARNRARNLHPNVGSDGANRFIVVWSTIEGARAYDLHARRYGFELTIPTPEAPFVNALSQSTLQVTWAPLSGYSLGQYELAIGSAQPVGVNGTFYNVTGLAPSSSTDLKVRYVLTSGDKSAWSPVAVGKTWGADENFDGLPDDWQALYWGSDSSKWPAGNEDTDGDGVSNVREFLTGTLPNDAASVLKMSITRHGGATEISWNTVPGALYQVQNSPGLPLDWKNVGAVRLAHGTSDALVVPSAGHRAEVYRVIRVR